MKRPCNDLPAGAPCPVPDNCECVDEQLTGDRRIAGLLAALAIIASAVSVAFGAYELISIAFGADVDPACMTHDQAKAKYPKAYLYWHTPRHCWSPKAIHYDSRAAVYGKTNSLKLAPPSHDANANIAHHSGKPIEVVDQKSPSIAYPTLMAGRGTDDTMLHPGSITSWPLITDFDSDPPQFLPWQQRVSVLFDDAK